MRLPELLRNKLHSSSKYGMPSKLAIDRELSLCGSSMTVLGRRRFKHQLLDCRAVQDGDGVRLEPLQECEAISIVNHCLRIRLADWIFDLVCLPSDIGKKEMILMLLIPENVLAAGGKVRNKEGTN